MRILIVGAGAVGGYLGARLVHVGADVTLLVRPDRAASLAADGLVVHRDGIRTATPVSTVTADRLGEHWDVVVLAVKSTALPGALDDLAPAIGERTMILPILNGIDHIAACRTRFGAKNLLGGVAAVATELRAGGEIAELAPGASIALGELDGSVTERATRLHDLFTRAGIDTKVSEHIVQDMWEKWLFMAAGGAATVLLGGPVGAIVAVENGPAVVGLLIDEAVEVQRAEGFPPRSAYIERIRALLTEAGSTFTTSMYRDFVAGRATEAEPILGSLIHRAVKRGIATPLLDAAIVRLRIHEASRSSA